MLLEDKRWKVTATTTASLDGASTLWAKSRPPGGIRHCSANHVRLLRFIKEAQALWFSFNEVQDLPALSRKVSTAVTRNDSLP